MNIKPLTSDREMTRLYLEALTGDGQAQVTWQYFADSKLLLNGKSTKSAGHLHGNHLEVQQELERRQVNGCGIFVMVNGGDGKGRTGKNVLTIRALFIDLDGAPMEPAARSLRPHIIVESSPGRYHLYWKVSGCPIDRFTPLQKAIALKFNGDTACVDLARVLRVPGFWHLKGEPVMTRLLEVNDHPTYLLDEIVAGLGLSSAAAEPQHVLSTRSAQLEQRCNESVPSHRCQSCEVVSPTTGEVIDLKKWAATNPDFDLVGTLNRNVPEVLRGRLRDGRLHIQCPFAHEHTDTAPDLATFAANKGDSYASWDIHCMHAHCAGRDRLHFLKRMLDMGWLPADILFPPQGSSEPRRVPPKVYLPHQDIAVDAAWSTLTPEETRFALHLYLLMSRTLDGRLPDDDWRLARLLGITEEVFGKVKATLERVGWLEGDGIHIWNSLAAREVTAAVKAYNGKVDAGRKRQDKARRDKEEHTPHSLSLGGSFSISTSASTSTSD